MIYGQFAKDYATSRTDRGGANFNVVSESDAIIECLINEASNYNYALLNESFVSDEERLVMEAKIEALNEAVGAAIVAAIIAIVTAIGVLLVKLISLFKKGKTQISENAKKSMDNLKEKAKDLGKDKAEKKKEEKSKPKKEEEKESQSSKSQTSSEKKASAPVYRPPVQRTAIGTDKSKDAEVYYKRLVDEIISKQSKEQGFDGMIPHLRLDPFWNKLYEDIKSFDLLKEEKGAEMKKPMGISTMDFTKVINQNAIKNMENMLRSASNDRDISGIDDYSINNGKVGMVGSNGSIKTDASQYLYDSLVRIGAYAFTDEYKKKDLKPSENLFRIYNENTLGAGIGHFDDMYIGAFEVLDQKIMDSANKVIAKMNSDLESFKRHLERLKKLNYNDADFTTKIPTKEELKKKHPRWTDQDIQDEIDELKGSPSKSEENKGRFMANMLYVEKHAVEEFRSLTTAWSQIESHRLQICNHMVAFFNKHFFNSVKKYAYLETQKKFGDAFKMEDPCPDYK